MRRAIAGTVLLALLLSGCGSEETNTVVRIHGTSATPQTLTVEKGADVVFASGDGSGTVTMSLDLPPGSYPFVIDDEQAADTFALLIE